MEKGDRAKRTELFFENRKKFEAWLTEHPVIIPQEIIDQEIALQKKADTAANFEEWKIALEEIRAHIGPYQRLYRLRLHPAAGSKNEIAKLEEELSDCYCGSGKKFKECHGV